ncbi:MAG: sugar ABC transporter permease [Propionibacteriaceae bacterium]|jgi:putative multiple sugar transport system permease protein|nr:sugar ABC transporter permease [Propionibacteriaceae bacterium]
MSTLKESLSGNLRQYGIMAALLAVVVVFGIMTGGKLLFPDNVADLVRQNAYVLILAIGMVMVIVAGHIDLSVGSLVAFIGGVLGWAMYYWNWPWPLAVLLALAIGAAVGVWHGFWIAYVRIPAFIVTLAGMLIFRGLAIIIAGVTMAGFDSGFVYVAAGSIPNFFSRLGPLPFTFGSNQPVALDLVTVLIGVIGIAGLIWSQIRARASQEKHGVVPESMGLFVGKTVVTVFAILALVFLLAASSGGSPVVLIIVGVLIAVYSFVLNRTVFGRHVYAVGGNLNAAILSGINTARTNFFIFLHMGLLSAVAAIVVTSRAGAATSTAGQSYELDAIAACFIGGTAVTGGIGRISGAMVGALIMGVINMGSSIYGIAPAWQQVVKGLVLLAAVAFDLLSKRRAKVN